MTSHRPIILHTSWRGRFTAFFGPMILLLWGVYGAAAGGIQIFNAILIAMGVILSGVVAFDYPMHSRIGADGISRRCLLRIERLTWDRVTTVARPGARQRIPGTRRDPVGDRPQGPRGKSGLIAEVGRRPYMLVDRIESPAEHEAIEQALRHWAPGLILRATRPVDGTPPTWLYKTRRASVDGMVDRHG